MQQNTYNLHINVEVIKQGIEDLNVFTETVPLKLHVNITLGTMKLP